IRRSRRSTYQHQTTSTILSHFLTYTILTTALDLPFFFTHTPPTDIYPLSLHDALPIYSARVRLLSTAMLMANASGRPFTVASRVDRKSTRLNSSHVATSYAVFCLKKKTTLASRHTPALSRLVARRPPSPYYTRLSNRSG